MSSVPGGDADLSAVGALLAEPARAAVLLALADGRRLPASMLASEVGVAPSTMSEHLRRLLDGGLVAVHVHGRYRYYEIAGPEVSRLVEAVAQLSPAQPVRSLRAGTKAHRLRLARRCYDHLGGRLAVALTIALIDRGVLAGHDGTVDFETSAPATRVTGPGAYSLTASGLDQLARVLGLRFGSAPPVAVSCCVDWTEQRHHISGPLGASLLRRFDQLAWLTQRPRDRALTVTDVGRRGLREAFDLDASLLAETEGQL